VDTARLFYGEPVNLMFARQNRISLDELQRHAADYDYRGEMIGTITVGSPERYLPLQCADILAYEVSRAQRAGRDERYLMRYLIDGAKRKGGSFTISFGPIRGSAD
jgi:hypothetical protein